MQRRIATAIILLTSTFLLLIAHRATTDVFDGVSVGTSVTSNAQQRSETTTSPLNLLFVGDIMLGRNVELLMEKHGVLYPFAGTNSLLKSSDLTIGNFEGIVSPVHERAEPMTFKFSIKEEFLGILRDVGVDVLSLANNHSYDYGSSAFQHTSELCLRYELVCGGLPSTLSEDSAHTQIINGREVSILFIHTLYREPDTDTLRALLRSINQSEIQIAYVHWGEEYALTHNEEQRFLAEFLIDHGIDVVVGHHPHVVQDVEVYKGKAIFYSLGNFVFDQYFSRDVQEMVALDMHIGTSTIRYFLIPLTSEEVRSQPSPMNEVQKSTLFERVFANLKAVTPQVVDTGELVLPL